MQWGWWFFKVAFSNSQTPNFSSNIYEMYVLSKAMLILLVSTSGSFTNYVDNILALIDLHWHFLPFKSNVDKKSTFLEILSFHNNTTRITFKMHSQVHQTEKYQIRINFNLSSTKLGYFSTVYELSIAYDDMIACAVKYWNWRPDLMETY